MSRKHPQDGPSQSKATYKKPKPLSDEELAAKQAREARAEEARMARIEAAQQKVAEGRRRLTRPAAASRSAALTLLSSGRSRSRLLTLLH